MGVDAHRVLLDDARLFPVAALTARPNLLLLPEHPLYDVAVQCPGAFAQVVVLTTRDDGPGNPWPARLAGYDLVGEYPPVHVYARRGLASPDERAVYSGRMSPPRAASRCRREATMARPEQTRIDVESAGVAEGIVVVRPSVGSTCARPPKSGERLVAEISAVTPRLIVDLGETTFLDSSGLGALIGGLKAARQAGGDLRLARPGEQARVVLQLTALDRVLPAYESVAQALDGY